MTVKIIISNYIRNLWYETCIILIMKRILVIFALILGGTVYGQNGLWPSDSLKEYEGEIVPVYTKEYLNRYNRMKRLVVKVYPYALYAADVIDQVDHNAEKIEKRRKKNRFYKEAYKHLKNDFKYFILDLYTSEGRMLMKLIHRETGMTVYDISSKYRGETKANMFNTMAKMWDQDLHITFEPNIGDDRIVEQVIKDIQAGIVEFDDEIVSIDRLTYKEGKKADKERKKKSAKKYKHIRKQKRKNERRIKKAARKAKRE